MKTLTCYFRLELLFVFVVIVGLTLPVTAQKEKTIKRKKFGWSLKKSENNSEKKPKTDKSNAVPDEDEVIKVGTDLIVNDILVLDQKGEPVVGLKQDDFVVVEDDVTQEIELFSAPDKPSIRPRYYVFIIDHSNSHNDGHMRNSVDAARLFVDKLAPQDKMAIVTSDVKLIQDFTNDQAKLKKQLESVYKDNKNNTGRSGGDGLTYTALFVALNEIFDEEGIRPIIIMQSVGRDIHMLKDGKLDASRSPYGLFTGFYDFSFEDLLRKMVEKRVTVYSIITGRRFAGLSDEEKIKNLVLMQIDCQYEWTPVKLESIVPLDKATDYDFVRRIMQDALEYQEALIELAETSGGTVNFLQTPEDTKNIYADIFSSIEKRYLIGYYSKNQKQDKKLRNVRIEVRGHPKYLILGRKTYFPR
jgi:VWFA-related protein